MANSFKKGDSIEWDTSQGETHGKVVKKQTSKTHNDAGGLCAAAVLARVFRRADAQSWRTHSQARRKSVVGGDPEKNGRMKCAGLIVTDLGVRTEPVIAGSATVFIDHHVLRDAPVDATVISGYGEKRAPTSSMLHGDAPAR